MMFEAKKLGAVLVVAVAAAATASACGDDSTSAGGGGGAGATAAAGDTTAVTGSGGGDADPCAIVPDACFDPACFVGAKTGVSLKTDLLPLMQRSCSLSTACHANPTSPTTNEGYKPYLGNKKGDGESDTAAIVAALVGVDAYGDPSRKVVVPGDWEASYFMNKLDGALDQCGDLDCLPDCGRLMPQGSPKPLPIAERNLFRTWIEEGALDN